MYMKSQPGLPWAPSAERIWQIRQLSEKRLARTPGRPRWLLIVCSTKNILVTYMVVNIPGLLCAGLQSTPCVYTWCNLIFSSSFAAWSYIAQLVVAWGRHQMETLSALLGSFVWGIHQSLVNSLHKGQWHWALMFSLIWAWTNSQVSNRDAADLKRHRTHYDVIVVDGLSVKRGLGYEDTCLGSEKWSR